MFERYNESARRALFFARVESSQLGALAIAPEHLLLGISREPGPIVEHLLLTLPATIDSIRAAIASRIRPNDAVGTSVEIPFSGPAKHALQFGTEEADGLQHDYIGPEHLLLGLIREGESVAAAVLADLPLPLERARQVVARLTMELGGSGSPDPILPGVERRLLHQRSAAFDEYVGLIKRRVDQLAGAEDTASRQALANEIQTALDSLHDRF
jgi:ATP-dependent Clp protease ATP-binding subunit ClpC